MTLILKAKIAQLFFLKMCMATERGPNAFENLGKDYLYKDTFLHVGEKKYNE